MNATRKFSNQSGVFIANTVKQRRCEENLKNKNEEMTFANSKLAETNELKNSFLGIASHDLAESSLPDKIL